MYVLSVVAAKTYFPFGENFTKVTFSKKKKQKTNQIWKKTHTQYLIFKTNIITGGLLISLPTNVLTHFFFYVVLKNNNNDYKILKNLKLFVFCLIKCINITFPVLLSHNLIFPS